MKHPNAIVRAALFIPKLQGWANKYEERFLFRSEHGTILPKVVIGAVRGGNPYHVTRTSEICAVYIDCRLTPNSNPVELREELINLLQAEHIEGEVELFVYRRSYEPGNVGILLDGLRKAHKHTFNAELALAVPAISSMWRDVSIFNEMGIPSITYGPPRNFKGQSMAVADLVRTAQIYAQLAIDICNREKPKSSARRVDSSLRS